MSTILPCCVPLKRSRRTGALKTAAILIWTRGLVIGKTISHYRILDKLGSGGMGEVYVAEDTTLNRKVALKFQSVAPDSAAKQRFMQEARAAAKLRHSNIVHIYEVGEADGQPFFAMEYVEGETLDRRIGKTTGEISEIIRIAADIADALDEAHRAGITHRDIKPANVMITPRGQVKVLDFGLARLDSETSLTPIDASTQFRTGEGVVVGTLVYMSPEQALGRRVDSRSDLFSFGVLLYELITGRRPFSAGSAMETLDRILHAQPEPIGRWRPEAPPELERIIRKCLEKDPDRRYQTARDLRADLRNIERPVLLPERAAENRDRAVWRPAVVLLSFVLVVAGAAIVWRRTRNVAVDSLAVLPFNNTGGNATEYLSDGITENLIDRFSNLSHLRVVPRSSVFRYKDRDLAPQAVGRELRVRAVLLGRVQQRGQTLSIRAELIDVPNDAQLWGAQYDRSLAQLQSVQEEIASAVTERLRVKLTDTERRNLTRRYTQNSDAHLLYLKGRHWWNRRTPDAIRKGIDAFREAIDLDPGYSLAYAGLADCYNFLGAFGIAALPPNDTMPKARAAALKALEVNDSLAEAHTSLAFVKLYYDWDWSGAESEFKRAIELDHNYAAAHQWYSHLLMARGRTAEAVAAAKRAVELDPLSLPANMNVGWQYDWARQPELAVQQLRRTLELDPTFAQGLWGLGLAYAQKGMTQEAIAELQKAVAFSEGNAVYLASLGRVYAIAGRTADAARIRAELEERSKHSYVPPYWIAILCVGLRDDEQALQWLEKAYEERSGGLVWLAVDPRLDPLRSQPRFAALQQRIESASSIAAPVAPIANSP